MAAGFGETRATKLSAVWMPARESNARESGGIEKTSHRSGTRSHASAPIVSSRGLAAVLSHRWVVVLLWTVVAVKLLLLCSQLYAHFDPLDFGVYYASALVLRGGANPYLADLAEVAHHLGFDPGVATRATDPPTFLYLFEPLTRLPLAHAYWLWFALNLCALICGVVLLLRRPESKLTGATAYSIAALAMLFAPVGNDLVNGQSKTQIFLLLVVMIRLLESGREGWAGLTLAAAGLLRVFPLMLLGYFIIRGRRRLVIYTIAGVVAGGMLTMFGAGFYNCLGFLHAPAFLTRREFLANPSNIAINAVVSRGLWFIFGAVLPPSLNLMRFALVLIISAATLRWMLTATDRHADRDWRALSLWTIASVALSPTAWFFDLCLLLIPFILMCSAAAGTVALRALYMMTAAYLLSSIMGAAGTLMGNDLDLISWLQDLDFAVLAMGGVSGWWFANEPARVVETGSRAQAGPPLAA
jgi:hypothetical protein